MRANRFTSRPAGVRFWLFAILGCCAVVALTLPAWMAGRRAGGTLVVEAADPALEVVIAGEGVVRRMDGSGAAALPVGRYEVWCVWKGRPGPSLWMDVPAGGEVEARPPSPFPVRPAKPFVILARNDELDQAFDTLEEAVEAARQGETIEVHGNGPFVTPPLRIDRAIVIRSAPGCRPVLRLAAEAEGALLHAAAALVLEGLELDGSPAKGEPFRNRVVLDGDVPLYAAFCRLRQEGNSRMIRSGSKNIHLAHSVITGRHWSGLTWFPPAEGRLRLEGSLVSSVLVDQGSTPPRDVVVEIHHCTFTGHTDALGTRCGNTSFGKEVPLRILASGSVFAPSATVLAINRTGPEKWDAARAAASLPRLPAWRDEGNVYSSSAMLLRHFDHDKVVPKQAAVKTLKDWGQVWGAPAPNAWQGKISFIGSNRMDHPSERPVEAFRLAPGSPGTKSGPDGRDAGVDVDQLGPGPAYDRWRKTPAYEVWRRESGQLLYTLDEPGMRLAKLIQNNQWDEAKRLLSENAKHPDSARLIHAAARAWGERSQTLRRQRKQEQAVQAEQLARESYEKLLAGRPWDAGVAVELADLFLPRQESFSWAVLKTVKTTSAGGATLTRLTDGSIRAGGKSPDHDAYTIQASTDLPVVTALRLEVLPDTLLPHGGAGRSPMNGNFNLSEVRLSAGPRSDPAKAESIPFREAWSDYSPSEHPIAKAIDGDLTTWWEVYPRQKEKHTAIFVPRTPVGNKGGTELTIQLDCHRWKQNTLGRFRLSATAQPAPLRGEQWRQALARDEVSGWTYLAAAYHLRGDARSAIGLLEKVAPLSADRSAAGLFLLALVHQDLGQKKEARMCYDQGIKILKTQPSGELLNVLAGEAMRKVAELSEQQASELLASVNRQGEEAALSAAVQSDPANAQAVYKRGVWYAQHRCWKEAATDLPQAARLAPTDHWIWFQAAIVLASVGPPDAYRKHCQEMVERFGKSSDLMIRERIGKVGLLLAGTEKERKISVELVRAAVKEGGGHQFRRWFDATSALADYRESNFAAAEKTARKVLGEGEAHFGMLVATRTVLAMALHRLGKPAEAKTQFQQAIALLDGLAPTVEQTGGSWHDWVICRILFREAEEVLAGPAGKAES